jgi:hypothetical protein
MLNRLGFSSLRTLAMVAVRLAVCSALTHLPGFAQTPIELRISNESAPAGGFVQIKIFATHPALIASGQITLDLDPSVFGGVAGAAVFSPHGDAVASVDVTGSHLLAVFSSDSGGMGQLPDVPLLTLRVPLLASAESGKTVAVTATAKIASYVPNLPIAPTDVTVAPGQVTVGGSLFVNDVSPGGGLLPEGGVVRITGGGFDSSVTASIDGVPIQSVNYVSASEIDVAVGGPVDLTGKHVHVASADFYAAAPSATGASTTGQQTVHLVPPMMTQAYTAVNVTYSPLTSWLVALVNPTGRDVRVSFAALGFSRLLLVPPTITIPAYGLYVMDPAAADPQATTLVIDASVPIRMIEFTTSDRSLHHVEGPTKLQALQSPFLISPITSDPAPVNWQVGTPAPAPVSISSTLGIAVKAKVIQGGEWLSVPSGPFTGTVKATLDPIGAALKPGSYVGVVQLEPVDGPVDAVTIPPAMAAVRLNVGDAPFLSSLPARFHRR